MFETAKLAELNWHYAQDYFLYSKYVHSTVSGIISQEHKISRGHILQTTIFIVVSAAANVVQAIETQTPQGHIDEAANLIGLAIELARQGAFRDKEDGTS